MWGLNFTGLHLKEGVGDGDVMNGLDTIKDRTSNNYEDKETLVVCQTIKVEVLHSP